jgi:zinc protease
MKRIYCLLTAFPFFLLACAATQRIPEPEKVTTKASFELTQRLPVDPHLTRGTLENGLRYYIRPNRKPEKRAELRLVVNTGSVLEEADQQGLAHFAEHMAFNGTTHFPKHELVNYLESIGMRFGPELNAYTSFDETVYMLQVPTDSAGVVEKAFQVLEDWAHAISFDEQEIDKERGVVVEEWRLGRGAEARMRDKQLPIILKDSRYAERLPIGQKAVLDTFHYATLRRFYSDWYRPDLMAVIAVGDFDSSRIEGLIRHSFSRIPPRKDARERTVFPVPDHGQTFFAIASDSEATRSGVTVYYKQDVREQGTLNAYRQRLIEGLYHGMLHQRLYELTKQPEPPFLYGYSTQGRFIRSKEFALLGAGVKDNGIQGGLETLLTEAARVERYGFTPTELDRQKQEMLRSVEQGYKERDNTTSDRFAAEYIRSYLYDEPIPGIEYEYALQKQLIPEISLQEVNRLAGEWVSERNRVISVNAPEKPGVVVPSEEDLLTVFEAVRTKEISPYVDVASAVPLVETPPVPGGIVAGTRIDTLGVTEWKLTNGVRVVLKPTDFKNDEILFTAYSPGGHSLIADSHYVAALTATSVVQEGGIGSFPLIELQKRLAGKVVSVAPWISDLHEGLSGSASPDDVETLFQLIYLYCTAPRQDSVAFLAYRSRMRGVLENRSARPETAFEDTVQVTLTQHHYRARPWSVALLDEMDLRASLDIYRDRFADAGDLTCFFVGNIDTTTIKAFVQTYLGGLPSAGRGETWKDVGMKPPQGVVKKTVNKGREPKSLTQMIFTGPFQWTRQNRYDLDAMAQVLRIKLRDTLREDLGETYGVGVGASPSHYPREAYQMTIGFGCAPEKVEALTRVVFEQLDSLKTFGTTDVYIGKVKEMQRREREVALKENGFWLDGLQASYVHGEDPLNLLRYSELVEGLTPEAVRQAAQRYVKTDNYIKVVLSPEETH